MIAGASEQPAAEPAPNTFPGWPRLEPVLLDALVAGDEVKLTADEVQVVVGEMARLKERLEQAARAMRRVQGGDGCWGHEQGYAACAFKGVDGLLEGAAGRPRRRWWRKA